MKSSHLRFALPAIVLAALLVGPSAASADEVLLRVGGEVDKPLELTRADFEAMPRARFEIPTRDDPKVLETWEGVPMIEILRKAGAPVDDRTHGRCARYVLVTAADGYKAVYSLAEIDPAYAPDNQVLVADRLNGEPLSGRFGHLRVANQGERRFSRWVRQVVRLDLRTAE